MNERDKLINAIARLISGLHVPVSMAMPLGHALQAYSDARDTLRDFGYSTPEDLEPRIRAILDGRQ